MGGYQAVAPPPQLMNQAASQTGYGIDSEGNLREQAACLEGPGYSVK
jgi:hypothetical protein